jgi:hypothetical protein
MRWQSSCAAPRPPSRRTSWKVLHAATARDRLHLLNIAEASLAEVGSCVHVARRLDYISVQLANQLETEIRQVGAPLSGLVRSARAYVAAKTAGMVLLFASIVLSPFGAAALFLT